MRSHNNKWSKSPCDPVHVAELESIPSTNGKQGISGNVLFLGHDGKCSQDIEAEPVHEQ